MKQNITEEELSQLSQQGKDNLLKYLKQKHIYNSDSSTNGWLSIGQMIEFLDEQGDYVYSKQDIGGTTLNRYWTIRLRGEKRNKFGRKELCDALFKAVKEILEYERKILQNNDRRQNKLLC